MGRNLFTAAMLGVAVLASDAAVTAEPRFSGGPPVMHRLLQDQFRNSIRDIFGESIVLGGRFEPDPRADGLIAVGGGRATVTAAGMEQYDQIANSIAGQVVDAKHRAQLIPCKPARAEGPDAACARRFLSDVGHLLFRRPLSTAELAGYVKIAEQGALRFNDFHLGLAAALTGMLESPQFLFWMEQAERDGSRNGYRLTPASMAARISFLLWNTTPDLALLAAAESGELNTREGLEKQVDRMLASPRLEVGVRAFFRDMFGFDTFDSLAKDVQLYPVFSREVIKQAEEQTLRTVVDHLLVQDGDYRDLFTTPRTFVTPLLATLYRLPLNTSPNALTDQWTPYEIPDDRPQAGILTHASFLALHSHPGATSPTLRGKALREVLMCQKVPDPPANVDFTKFAAPQADGGRMTMRELLREHTENPVCAGCHKITDPIGLALEHYDTVGTFRPTDQALPIDTSGQVDGAKFTDASTLGQALRGNTHMSSCLVRRVFAYATGRPEAEGDSAWLDAAIGTSFERSGYRFRSLLRRLTTDPDFYRVSTRGLP